MACLLEVHVAGNSFIQGDLGRQCNMQHVADMPEALGEGGCGGGAAAASCVSQYTSSTHFEGGNVANHGFPLSCRFTGHRVQEKRAKCDSLRCSHKVPVGQPKMRRLAVLAAVLSCAWMQAAHSLAGVLQPEVRTLARACSSLCPRSLNLCGCTELARAL